MFIKYKPFFLHIAEIKYKFLAFVLLFPYIIGLFSFALMTYRTDDQLPEIKMTSLKMRQQLVNLSSTLKTGLYIKNFSAFDFITNNFIVNAIVWFEYNKNEIPLKIIDQFSFENSKMISKSPPYVTMRKDTMVVKYDVSFELKTNVNFRRFPLEDHRLSVVLTNSFISPDVVYFDDSINSTSLLLSDKLFTSTWLIHSTRSMCGYASLRYDQHRPEKKIQSPKAAFIINFKKSGINKILLIFVPLFAAILLALFSFLLSFNNHSGKTSLSLTAVTALLGYRFVIQQMSPSVGYFTLTDKIFIFFLFFAFCIFIFHTLLSRHYLLLTDREKLKKSEQFEVDAEYLVPRITEHINTLAYFIFVLIFIIGITLFIGV